MRCPLVRNTLEGSSRDFHHRMDAYLYSPSFRHGSKLRSDLGEKRLAKQRNSAVKKGTYIYFAVKRMPRLRIMAALVQQWL